MNTFTVNVDVIIVAFVTLVIGLVTGWLLQRLWGQRQKRDLNRDYEQNIQLLEQRHQQEMAMHTEQLKHLQSRLEEQAAALKEATLHAEAHDKANTDAQVSLASLREKLANLDQTALRLEQRDKAYAELLGEHRALEARREQESKHYQAQLQLLEQNKQALKQEFEHLANKIFENKQQQFSQQSQQTLALTLNPVKDQLKAFREQIESAYQKESSERNQLVGQIAELQKQTRQIGEDAVNLARALKGDKKAQGNWGEVILERLLEESGLQKGREYETQVALNQEDGRRRNPDVIVHLPENKDIIIDAKVSLVDYDSYCSAEDDDSRRAALKRHISALRNHVNQLSVKAYENLPGIRSLDFVFIFIPVEPAFMLALQEEPGLFREAYERHIILVSPTTLLATLRTVENIWRYEKQNRNAEKIARDAGSLYDQFVLLLEALDDVGKHIQKTQESYETAHKRLSTGRGNLLRRVEQIKKLGAKAKKQINPQQLESADSGAHLLDTQEQEGVERVSEDT